LCLVSAAVRVCWFGTRSGEAIVRYRQRRGYRRCRGPRAHAALLASVPLPRDHARLLHTLHA